MANEYTNALRYVKDNELVSMDKTSDDNYEVSYALTGETTSAARKYDCRVFNDKIEAANFRCEIETNLVRYLLGVENP